MIDCAVARDAHQPGQHAFIGLDARVGGECPAEDIGSDLVGGIAIAKLHEAEAKHRVEMCAIHLLERGICAFAAAASLVTRFAGRVNWTEATE